jgi:hypothetical protein
MMMVVNRPRFKAYINKNMSFVLISLIAVLFFAGLFYLPVPTSFAHFGHLTHYNTGGVGVGKYYINEQIEPEYTPPLQPAKISFSIQDTQGNDVYNLVTLVEVYSESTGDRMVVYPWTKHDIGDFSLYYVFPKTGNYQIVVSIANNAQDVNLYGVDPPRSILSSNLNCDCYRAVFNVSISNNFGSVFQGSVFAGIAGLIVVFGLVLVFTYRNRKKLESSNYPILTKNEIIKYSVLLLAIAAGIVHLAVFSEHASLRIEYSIFLLAAGASQVAYSMLYVLLTITSESTATMGRGYAKSYYRKSVVVNLFGLIGSSVLLGLYLYSVIFIPPLSPNNGPEDVDVGGVLDKSLEIGLVIGIVYLMNTERRKLHSQFINAT